MVFQPEIGFSIPYKGQLGKTLLFSTVFVNCQAGRVYSPALPAYAPLKGAVHLADQGIVICRSIFKSGENTPDVERFTKAWAALIEQMEKAKEALGAAR